MIVFILAELLYGVFPDFSLNGLTLLGVSGGAYVGFKAVAAKSPAREH